MMASLSALTRIYELGILVILSQLISYILAYECIEKCGPFGRTVYPRPKDDQCLVAMPDNPTYAGGKVMPCEMEIQSNCSSFCLLEVKFAKFALPKCNYNFTYQEGKCNNVERCEYIVIKETGTTVGGTAVDNVHIFDGDKTEDLYVSTTNRIMLQFCYRSETFSARNIQLEYRAMDPVAEAQINLGPVSVWVLGFVVILLILLIVVIARCPWLRPCLDPPVVKQPLDF